MTMKNKEGDNNQMKILLIGPYPPPHGGISVHVAALADQLSQRGAEIRVFRMSRGARASGASRLARTVRQYASKGWIIHFHTNGHNLKSWVTALLSAAAARKAPATVLTLHSGMLPDYLKGSGGATWTARLTCALYNRIICVNGEIRRSLVRKGVPGNRLHLMPAFIPPSFTPVPLLRQSEDWIRQRHPLVSVTLSFQPEYGLNLMLNAIHRLRADHPKIGCLVIGGGEDEKEVRAQLNTLGLNDSVLLVGDISHEACLTLMSRSDLFVRPSYKDGDSSSVREALSLGIPVVASRLEGRPRGTVLFESGNVNDLVSRIRSVLDAYSVSPAPAKLETDPVEALLKIYEAATAGRSGGQRARRSESAEAQWQENRAATVRER